MEGEVPRANNNDIDMIHNSHLFFQFFCSYLCSFHSWYDESQIIVFDIYDQTSWSGKIIGVAESDSSSKDPILIKLESGSGKDW